MRIVKPGSPAPDIGDFEITEIRYIGEEGHKVIIPRVEVSLYRSYARYRRLKAIYVTAIKGQLHQGHLELLKELINEEAAMVALIVTGKPPP